MKRYILLIFSLFVILSTSLAEEKEDVHDYGLFFHSHSVMTTERTSLFLEDKKPYNLTKELAIDFELFIRNETLFGHILTIHTDANKYIFLSIVTLEDDVRCPALIIDEEVYPLASDINMNEWFPVSITFNAPSNNISVNYNDKVKKITYPLENVKSLQLVFGTLSSFGFEVSPMNLRDIKIQKDGKPFRYWKLKQHNRDICYDELHKVPAIAVNPRWLIDGHIAWSLVFSSEMENLMGTAFNPESATFYMIAQNNILSFDPIKKEKNYIPVKGGYPAMEFINHLVYDTISNQLLSYDLYKNILSSYSFNTNMWSSPTRNMDEPHYFNHSRAYCADDSSYYAFGGYGFYRFSNDLYKITPSTGTVEKINYKPMIPFRVFSAAGIIGEKLYIFGGQGNETGHQEVLSHNYFDLYVIDLKTKKSKKLWYASGEIEAKNMTMSSTMYYSPQDSAFFVGVLSKGGRIMKVSLVDSTYTFVSQAIDNKVAFHELDFNLFFAPKHNRIFAVMDKVQKNGLHDMYIYSIGCPLLTEQDILQTTDEANNTDFALWKQLSIILVMILAGLTVVYFAVSRNRKKNQEKVAPDTHSSLSFTPIQASEDNIPHKEIKKYFDRSKTSISLLGTFNVRDKNGNNITYSFTPRLKNLLIVLILYSEKKEQGILLKKLDDLLWMDKDEVSARNNRNVALRKLRVLLESVGDIEIVNDAGFIRIETGENVFCDYFTIKKLSKELKLQKDTVDKELLYKILEILLYGPLLTDTIVDWLDDFKSEDSTHSIDLLNDLINIERKEGNRDTDLILCIADTMFLHDPLNEEALVAKCSALYAAGKKGIAKNVYNKFVKEYKELLGENYKIPFSDICKS